MIQLSKSVQKENDLSFSFFTQLLIIYIPVCQVPFRAAPCVLIQLCNEVWQEHIPENTVLENTYLFTVDYG